MVFQYGFFPDIMATFIDVANAKYPTLFNGYKIVPAAEKCMIPLFNGKDEQIHTEPFFGA